MQYADLQALIRRSSSARRYFLTLPPALQLRLHAQNDWIHSAEELHLRAAQTAAQAHAEALADGRLR